MDGHDATALIDQLVAPRLGVIHLAGELDPPVGFESLSIWVACGPRNLVRRSTPVECNGTGVALDRGTARIQAVFEAVERLCGETYPDDASLVVSESRNPPTEATPLSCYAWPAPWQYAHSKSAADLLAHLELRWTSGISLTRRARTYVPAAMVFRALNAEGEERYLLEPPVSGFACHVVREQAILNGLFEVLERDALVVSWYNRLPLLPIEAASGECVQLIADAERVGYSFRPFLIPSDSPFPVVLGLLTSSAPPLTVVGSACRSSVQAAGAKALYEACQVLLWLRARPWLMEHPPAITDHASFYGTPRGTDILSEWLNVSPRDMLLDFERSPASAQGYLDIAVTELASAGREVIVVDIPARDVAGLGIAVVRVIVPGALDITAHPLRIPLRAQRLSTVPAALGYQPRPDLWSIAPPIPLA